MIIDNILNDIDLLPEESSAPIREAWLDTATRYFAPGRINLIGEHLDYNGGLVLPAAISLGTTLYVCRTDTETWELSTNISEERYEIDLKKGIPNERQGNWADYILAIGSVLQQHNIPLYGAKMHFETTLPVASGLSSSACVEVLTAFALHDQANSEIDRTTLAKQCQQAENDFIGVPCGIMDQYAIAHGKENHALLLDCQKETHEYVPLDFGHYKLLILDTKKPRHLIESMYQERKTECEEAFAFMKKRNGSLKSLTQVHVHEAKLLPKNNWKNRVMHIITEHRRVVQAVRYLKQNDLVGFGKLMNESHLSLRDDYKVTGDELDAIVAVAQRQAGCLGARMTGAGFGGCAIALVHKDNIKVFTEKLRQKYFLRTQLHAEVYSCEIVDGVQKING